MIYLLIGITMVLDHVGFANKLIKITRIAMFTLDNQYLGPLFVGKKCSPWLPVCESLPTNTYIHSACSRVALGPGMAGALIGHGW